MRKIKWVSLIALIVFGLCSCEKESISGNPTDPTNPACIFGLWQEQDDDQSKEYKRFLTADEEAKDGEYFFGREWDEGDNVYEKDLKYKGNGWFKWKIEGSTLTTIELMDNGSAEIPEVYTITSLNTTHLKLQDPGDKDVDTWIRK